MRPKIAIILTSFLLLISCASNGKWKDESIHPLKKVWRQCKLKPDGIKKAGKGFCYFDKECKTVFLIKTCRQKPIFCKYEDVDCKRKNQIDDMVLRVKK